MSKMRELEQIALRVAKESKLNEFMWLDESIETFTDEVVAVTDFAQRLVAALGAQEPVAEVVIDNTGLYLLKGAPDNLPRGTKLYAAPRLPQGAPRYPWHPTEDDFKLPQREGWQWVPVEPTREMIDAYLNQGGLFQSGISDWKAMLAAAPKPEDV